MDITFKKHLKDNDFICLLGHQPMLITITDSPFNSSIIRNILKKKDYLYDFIANDGSHIKGQIVIKKEERGKLSDLFSMGCTWKILEDIDVFELELQYI
ncbi:MAG TPA: hypothetical protein P5136_01100 [Methanofastidiosum sp.]|nr:hypothetical protein [Methanofastidiosum sp.]